MSKPSETNWDRVDALSDDRIDFSDVPELTEEEMSRARVRLPEQTARNYLHELGYLLREAAVEAQRQSERLRAEGKRDTYEMGRAAAYYEIVSLMAQQAEAFGLDRSALAFEGFDPDQDLTGASNRPSERAA